MENLGYIKSQTVHGTDLQDHGFVDRSRARKQNVDLQVELYDYTESCSVPNDDRLTDFAPTITTLTARHHQPRSSPWRFLHDQRLYVH